MSDVTIVLNKHQVIVDRLFAENVWELAFGDNAWENDYTDKDVLHTLKGYSVKALAWDSMCEDHQPNDEDEDTQDNYDLREKMAFYLGSVK
jgi:hypothetical protein|tara:strand:+ start:443 stop:715 length:273 start_codon:yes stop_codon:yes gene_type:complete